MNQQTEQVDLIKRFLTDKPIAYHPMLAHALGGVTDALFLSQLLYWSNKGHDEDGWIWKTQEAWTEETGLTRYEQESVRKHLKTKGIIEEKREGIPARLFYRINWPTLLAVLNASLQPTSVLVSSTLVCDFTADKSAKKPQTIYRNSESTPENTGGDFDKSPVHSPMGLSDVFQPFTERQTELDCQHIPEEDPPEYYKILATLPGWAKYGVSPQEAEKWRTEKGISLQHAEDVALAEKAKWGGKGWKNVDPWATFQVWVKRPPLPGTPTPAPPLAGRHIDPGNGEDLTQYFDEAKRIGQVIR